MHTSSRGSILILALSQALMLSAIVLSMTLAAILGSMLAPDKGLATLPAAGFMRRYGHGRGRRVVAAFVGPQLAQWGRDWIAGEIFVAPTWGRRSSASLRSFCSPAFSFPGRAPRTAARAHAA